MTISRAGINALATASLMLLVWPMANAAVTTNDLTGSQSDTEGGCAQPIPTFFQVDCSYNATNPSGLGWKGWVGPTRVSAFYLPGMSPYAQNGGNPATAPTPDPDKGELALLTGSVINIDDQGSATCSDDTLSGSLIMSGGAKWTDVGQGNTIEESWADGDVSWTFPATVVTAGTGPNADGGCDYQIATKGFPEPLVEDGGSQTFPADVNTSDDNPALDPQFWATPNPVVAMASFEDTSGGNLGIPAADVTTGPTYQCLHFHTDGNDLCSDPASSHYQGILAQYKHVYVDISTNSDGDILSGGRIWQKGETAILAPPWLPNSWTASLLTISGTCNNCGPAVDAADDNFNVLQNAAMQPLAVGANDANFTDPVTAMITVMPDQSGTAAVNSTSPGPTAAITIDYTPAAGFAGQETFTYQLEDANTATDTAVVTVNVLAAGANDDTASTHLNTALTAIPTGVNDVGFTDPVTIIVTVPPNAGGTIDTINGSGGPAADVTIDYTPVAPLGTATYMETFTYQLTDSSAPNPIIDTAVVTVTIDNAVPNAVPANATSPEDGSANTDVAGLAGIDLGDAPSTVVVTAAPSNGTTAVTGNVITYTPNAFYVGNDSYDYTITDVDGETSTATVSVTVAPALVPTANDNDATVDQDDTVDIDVTANDMAGSGSLANHTVTVSTAPANGTTSVSAANIVTYTPNAGFGGTDSFVYMLEDEDKSDADHATVTLTVIAEEPPPDYLPGGGSAIDPWTLSLLLVGLPALRRRCRQPDA